MCTHAWVLIMRLCFLFQVCCNLQSCQCVELAVAESVSSPEPVSVAIRHFWDQSTPSINCCDKTDRSDLLQYIKTGRSSCFQCERNDMIRQGGLCPLNPDCVAIHSFLDLPFTGSHLNFMSDHCLALSVIHSFCKCPSLLMNKIGYLFGAATFVVDCLFQLSTLSKVCISCHSCWQFITTVDS